MTANPLLSYSLELPSHQSQNSEMLAKHMTDGELLASLLSTDSRTKNAHIIASNIWDKFNGYCSLQEATFKELTKIKGVSSVKANKLISTIEFCKRMRQSEFQKRPFMCKPKDLAEMFIPEMKTLQQENFVVVFLNRKNQIIHQQILFIGCLSKVDIHPREIFREAVRRSAASIVCLHNHPSGDPTPSTDDIKATKRLVKCSDIMGIQLVDHLIIGDEKYTSLREQGFIPY